MNSSMERKIVSEKWLNYWPCFSSKAIVWHQNLSTLLYDIIIYQSYYVNNQTRNILHNLYRAFLWFPFEAFKLQSPLHGKDDRIHCIFIITLSVTEWVIEVVYLQKWPAGGAMYTHVSHALAGYGQLVPSPQHGGRRVRHDITADVYPVPLPREKYSVVGLELWCICERTVKKYSITPRRALLTFIHQNLIRD